MSAIDDSTRAAADLIAGLDGGTTLAGQPEPLDGARSAQLYQFRLTDGPSDLVDRELVLRLLPERATSLAEVVIQAGVSELGFPTPAIRRMGVADGRRYAVMDHVEGSTLFEADRLGALHRIPDRLADLMAELHHLDPGPLAEALTASGAPAACDLEAAVVAQIGADLYGGDDRYQPVLTWLDDHRPAVAETVVCHGDLHALNVMVNGAVAVLDWELAGIANPAFDVARTKLLMMAVPMELPRPIRPLVQRLGRRGAERFERAYRARRPLEDGPIAWYGVLHALRIAAMVQTAARHPNRSHPVASAWAPALPLLDRTMVLATGLPPGVDGRR